MNVIEVPNHLRLLGTEARRLRARLREALHADHQLPGKPRHAAFRVYAPRTVARVANDLATVESLFHGPIVRLGQRRQAHASRVLRITRSLERALNDLIGIWRDISMQTVDSEHHPEQHRLATGLRKSLEQVDDLLRRLVDRIDYPHLYQLPHLGAADDAPPLLAMSVDMHLPHELQPLAVRWPNEASTVTPPARNGRDLWATLGCLALGVLLGQALWGNDQD